MTHLHLVASTPRKTQKEGFRFRVFRQTRIIPAKIEILQRNYLILLCYSEIRHTAIPECVQKERILQDWSAAGS